MLNRRKILSILLSTLLIISLLSSKSIVTFAGHETNEVKLQSSKIVPVTRYQQENMAWCWAATAQMLGDYFGNYKTQSAICTKIKGGVVGTSASLAEVNAAIKYTTGKNVSTLGQIPMTDVVNKMDKNIPLGIRVQWSNSSGGGHALVLNGYNEGFVYLTDPWYGCGKTWVSYVNLCSGTTIESGTGYLAQTFYM